MDFFNRIGVMAIGSRLRMLSERMTKSSATLYDLYGVGLQPKWFPVFYALAAGEEKTITGIASEIGHSHPSVSKIVREMRKKGLITERKGKEDARKNVVSLSAKGLQLKEKIVLQYKDVTAAVENMLSQTTHNLWKAIEEWEYLLDQKDLYGRVLSEKKKRAAESIKIVDYTPEYFAAFRALNIKWISTYFVMEEADYKAIDHPEYILENGGHIFMALYQGEPVGTCALVRMEDDEYDYELAKMAVTPKAKGLGIGWLLGLAIIEKAKASGGKNLYLESNTKLTPAINLYHKLGFIKVRNRPSPYDRCNIQMAIEF